MEKIILEEFTDIETGETFIIERPVFVNEEENENEN